LIYIVHFIIIFILFFVCKTIYKNDLLFIRLSFFYSVIVFGQRWMVGTDYANYLGYYIANFQGTEYGYRTIQNFFYENNLSFSLMTFMLYLLTQINFYKFIRKFGANAVWIVFFYCLSEIYFAEMSQIRQWIAISFFINAFYYMFNKKYLKVIFFFICGFLFHETIIFMAPFLFIRANKLLKSKKVSLFVLFILFLLPFIDMKVFMPFLSNLELIGSYRDSPYIVDLSLLHYLKYYVVVLMTFIFIFNIELKNDKIYENILNGQVFYLILYGLSMQMAAFMRFSFYFKIYEIIFFVIFVGFLRKFNKKHVSYALIIYYLFIYISLSILDNVELAYFQIRFISLFEPYTHSELLNEIYEFLYKAGRR
jgi:hypothetical protein